MADRWNRYMAFAALLVIAALNGRADAATREQGLNGAVCGAPPGIEAADAKVPPLWMANGVEGSLSLERLARIAAPILWFSPREFLILEDAGRQPSPTPLDGKGALGVVYFRIRQIRLKRPPLKGAPVLSTDSAVLFDVDQPLECPGGSRLPLDEIDRVTIRYFFYYPEDRGIGGHPHDVEGIELQIRVRPTCWKGACFYGALLESVSGSAHGVGWYTSTLDVSRADDTELPLTILVEENKHASSPDRDGDGVYMPHYDINVYSNDGWGIRDIAGTGTLGSPAYTTEQSRIVRPLHPELRVFPPGDWPQRFWDAFDIHERKVISSRGAAEPAVAVLPGYELRRSWESRACDPKTGRADRTAITAAGVPAFEGLIALIDDPGFCEVPSQIEIASPFNLAVQKASDVLLVVYPGPRNQYGYMRWTERLSLSYRHDDGDGFTYVGPPIPGTQVPIFGGWIVGKLNVEFDARERRLATVALDAMYTPSASRSASWYAAAGPEWHYSVDRPAEGQLAMEFGLKFRFLFERAPLAKFWGGRIGIRANGSDPITRARLVFEFGAGAW